MSYYEKRVHRSASRSYLDDSGKENVRGFVDDEELSILEIDDPQLSLVRLGPRYRRAYACDGKCLVLIVGSLAVVALVAGMGIMLSHHHDNVEPTTTIPRHKGNGAVPKGWILDPPPIPKDLETLCTPLNLKNEKGYNDCLELCQPGICCEKIPDSNLSCLEEHRQVCQKYRASCQHLDHAKAISTKVTADKACSTDLLMNAEGVKACKQFCEPLSCCFDGSTNCAVTEAICSDNGACATALLVDRDGFEDYTEAKASIESACKDLSTYEGQIRCTNVCMPAQCCFLSPTVWKQPCHANCDHYQPCSTLYGTLLRDETNEKDANFSIPHQLEQACNPSQLETLTGVRECMDLCQHHLCCFDKSDVKSSCLDSIGNECDQYSACRALVDVEHTFEPPREFCDPKTVEHNGPHECMQSCAKHYCCIVDPRFEASCARDPACYDYRQCGILGAGRLDDEDVHLVGNINAFCTKDNLSSVLGATECENACSIRGCCIETGAGNCQDSDQAYCNEVASCQLLFSVDPTPLLDDHEESPNIVTQKLRSVCALENLSTLSGYHNCYDECFYHLCCFVDDEFLNCQSSKGEGECNEYSPCNSLVAVSGESSGDSSGDLNHTCSPSNVETPSGLEACRNACAVRLCCFQDPNLPSSCVGLYGQNECDIYEPCQILVSDSSHSVYNEEDPYLVALIDNYCKPESVVDEDIARKCMQQCEKRSCCFLTGDCYDVNQDWCDEVIACTNHPLIDAPKSRNGSNGTVSNLNGTSLGGSGVIP